MGSQPSSFEVTVGGITAVFSDQLNSNYGRFKDSRATRATFEGVGRLNGVDGYPFTGYVQDAGEPHGKKANDSDYFSITVRDPNTVAVVFEASATLDGGGAQIHPPTGKTN